MVGTRRASCPDSSTLASARPTSAFLGFLRHRAEVLIGLPSMAGSTRLGGAVAHGCPCPGTPAMEYDVSYCAALRSYAVLRVTHSLSLSLYIYIYIYHISYISFTSLFPFFSFFSFFSFFLSFFPSFFLSFLNATYPFLVYVKSNFECLFESNYICTRREFFFLQYESLVFSRTFFNFQLLHIRFWNRSSFHRRLGSMEKTKIVQQDIASYSYASEACTIVVDKDQTIRPHFILTRN